MCIRDRLPNERASNPQKISAVDDGAQQAVEGEDEDDGLLAEDCQEEEVAAGASLVVMGTELQPPAGPPCQAEDVDCSAQSQETQKRAKRRCRMCGHEYAAGTKYHHKHKGMGKRGPQQKQPHEVCQVDEGERCEGFPSEGKMGRRSRAKKRARVV